MKRIRKGDEVVVISGRDKGKRGTVACAGVDCRARVVEGVNRVKSTSVRTPMKGEPAASSKRTCQIMSRTSALQPGDPEGRPRRRVRRWTTDASVRASGNASMEA